MKKKTLIEVGMWKPTEEPRMPYWVSQKFASFGSKLHLNYNSTYYLHSCTKCSYSVTAGHGGKDTKSTVEGRGNFTHHLSNVLKIWHCLARSFQLT